MGSYHATSKFHIFTLILFLSAILLCFVRGDESSAKRRGKQVVGESSGETANVVITDHGELPKIKYLRKAKVEDYGTPPSGDMKSVCAAAGGYQFEGFRVAVVKEKTLIVVACRSKVTSGIFILVPKGGNKFDRFTYKDCE